MAEKHLKHPYVSGPGVLSQVLDHLKKAFPATVNAEVLKKLGFAPKNESYIINVLRYLNLIDDEGNRTENAQKTFLKHNDNDFRDGFSEILKVAYEDIFTLHREGSWSLTEDKLITFFRQTDQSSALVGKRQANTFKFLAEYAGKRQPSSTSIPTSVKRPDKPASRKTSKTATKKLTDGHVGDSNNGLNGGGNKGRDVGLTVRIEVNLPSTGDQEVYDKIFKSIRENLLNG